jgi:hypothetical protein
LPTFCPYPETLWEAKFEDDGLILLAEEISKQYSIQAVVWWLLAAFNQAYRENWEQKAEQKNLKNTLWPEKELKAVDKEGVVITEIN